MSVDATAATIAETVLSRVVVVAVFVSLGVFAANLLVGAGAVRYVARLARPLTGPANLPDEVGTAILATAASTTAGYGMLAEFRESGALDDRATLVAVTMNTFFGFVQHVFTYYVPVLIPILGFRLGVTYVGARAAVALCITLLGVLAGALLVSEGNVDRTRLGAVDATVPEEEAASRRELVRSATESTGERLRSVLPRLLVVYTLVVALTTLYDLTRVTGAADPLVGAIGLPAASAPVVAVFAVDTTSGAFVVAPLVPGTMSVAQATATMLLGGVVSFAVSTFKRSIPFQYSIWGPTFGSKVVAVNVAAKIVFVGAALCVLLAA